MNYYQVDWLDAACIQLSSVCAVCRAHCHLDFGLCQRSFKNLLIRSRKETPIIALYIARCKIMFINQKIE